MAEPTYKDLDFSFKKHPLSDDISVFSEDAAIRSALRNLVRLLPYDKPFQPGISSPLWRVMFEPATEATAAVVETGLLFLIQDYEPRVNNVRVAVVPYPDENKYEVLLQFTVRKSQNTQSLEVFLPVERLK
jgi:phage baseplate assembly protein W